MRMPVNSSLLHSLRGCSAVCCVCTVIIHCCICNTQIYPILSKLQWWNGVAHLSLPPFAWRDVWVRVGMLTLISRRGLNQTRRGSCTCRERPVHAPSTHRECYAVAPSTDREHHTSTLTKSPQSLCTPRITSVCHHHASAPRGSLPTRGF
jgi:hypothetical protein